MRIVSLCPSLSELVFDLGRGNDLVGITTWCVHPANRIGAVEKVGGTKDPEVERIVELAPDIVLMNEEENRLRDAQALTAAGIFCHATLPRTVQETADMVRSIGRILEAPEAAEGIAADIEERSARVRREAEGRREVRWAYLIWRNPWMAVGADTFAHALLTLAGGRNVFTDRGERYPEITPEELAAGDPELVLLGTEPFPFEDRHREELAAATDLPGERFRVADGEYLSWYGSRTPNGIDYAASLIEVASAGLSGR